MFRTRLSLWLACALVASLLLALVPTSAEGQVEVEFPVIALDDVDGGFFVLASDVPYQVSMTEPEIAWFAVETAEGPSTEPRIVSLSSNSAGLAPGTYYSAVRIDLTTTQGPRAIFVPVAMDVPAALQAEMALSAMAAGVPAGLAQMQIDHPGLDVRFQLTPARHYIVEVVDTEQELLRLQTLMPQIQDIAAASQTYEQVFPWMCLEVCGANVNEETADVAPNLDAVNGVSYERYEMIGGTWGVLRTGDPGPWASQNDLARWPMLIGGYHPTAASIQAMWNFRATILHNLIAEADANGYEGYTVDVEGVAESGRTTFLAVVDYLADGLHAEGYRLMVAHATWATLAPIADLARTSVDYVATMDPYTGWWNRYIPADYAAIQHSRLIWGFTWDRVSDATQTTMWNWMEANGYNVGVAGAAVWRTPLMPPHGGNTLDYYAGLRRFYPMDLRATPTPTETPTNTPTPTSTSTPSATPTPTFTPPPTQTPAPTLVFFDDFESDRGWSRNPFGSDSAITGLWTPGDPQDTSLDGAPMQLGTTVSGSRDLVTGPLAGAGVGSDDIDGGVTSIRSPNIVLPGSGDLRLSFSYYLAYLNNSSADDFLRVSVVGPSGSVTVFEERGAASQKNAAWAQTSVNLNSFAGQTIYLVIAAADAGGASLVEAAIDDVSIAAGPSGPPPGSVFFDDFEADLGWARNPSGIDTAATGLWDRADPQDTVYGAGLMQAGTTMSGTRDMVTGPLAGVDLGHHDIDGGVTTIRSPDIVLPASGNIRLTFFYYLAHTSNATGDDFLRVTVVGTSTAEMVFEELGSADNDYASWAQFSGSLSGFTGQTIYLLIEAADVAAPSLVEAGIDDLAITVGGT